MLASVQSFGLLLIGYILIFSGIAFCNKLFIPQYLGDFYQNTSFMLRTFLMCFIFGFPANLLISHSFTVTTPSITGPLMLAVILILTIINAMILDQVKITMPILGASAGALFFCCLTAWLLNQQA